MKSVHRAFSRELELLTRIAVAEIEYRHWLSAGSPVAFLPANRSRRKSRSSESSSSKVRNMSVWEWVEEQRKASNEIRSGRFLNNPEHGDR